MGQGVTELSFGTILSTAIWMVHTEIQQTNLVTFGKRTLLNVAYASGVDFQLVPILPIFSPKAAHSCGSPPPSIQRISICSASASQWNAWDSASQGFLPVLGPVSISVTTCYQLTMKYSKFWINRLSNCRTLVVIRIEFIDALGLCALWIRCPSQHRHSRWYRLPAPLVAIHSCHT